jgi:hypothetical protein
MYIYLSIFQCVIIALTAIIGIIELNKEFRQRADIAKKEAHFKRNLVVVLGIIGIVSQIFISIDSHVNSESLMANLKHLHVENDTLKSLNKALTHAVINEVDKNTAQIVLNASKNAIQASVQIKQSADSLNQLITGTDQPPFFYSILNYKTLHVSLKNLNNKPIINLRGALFDYEAILKCRSQAEKSINDSCLNVNKVIVNIPYMTTNLYYAINLPEGDEKKDSLHLLLIMDVKNIRYFDQVYIKIINHNAYTKFRMLKYLNGKDIVYKEGGDKNILINWDVEYPIDILKLSLTDLK